MKKFIRIDSIDRFPDTMLAQNHSLVDVRVHAVLEWRERL